MTRGSNDAVEILIASYLDPEDVDRIEQTDPRVRVLYRPELLPTPRYRSDHDGIPRQLTKAQTADWERLLARADVSYDFDWHQPRALRRTAPNLQWIQATSSGIGEFLVDTKLLDSDITFTTAAGIHARPLAEFATLSLLYFLKDVPRMRRDMQDHHWQRNTTQAAEGRRAVVVGMGNIGRQVSYQLDALGMTVTGVSRLPRSAPPGVSEVVALDDLSSVLPHTDALVLCCPLSSDTYHLIGGTELAAMPSGATLVNIARGPVVVEEALIEALRSNRLGGAALDVFETEPLPRDSALWELGNVLISPHSASTLADENTHIVDIFVDNISRWLRGEPLLNTFSRSDALGA